MKIISKTPYDFVGKDGRQITGVSYLILAPDGVYSVSDSVDYPIGADVDFVIVRGFKNRPVVKITSK